MFREKSGTGVLHDHTMMSMVLGFYAKNRFHPEPTLNEHEFETRSYSSSVEVSGEMWTIAVSKLATEWEYLLNTAFRSVSEILKVRHAHTQRISLKKLVFTWIVATNAAYMRMQCQKKTVMA